MNAKKPRPLESAGRLVGEELAQELVEQDCSAHTDRHVADRVVAAALDRVAVAIVVVIAGQSLHVGLLVIGVSALTGTAGAEARGYSRSNSVYYSPMPG